MIIQDLHTERRLLVAMLTEPEVLSAAAELETADFTDYRHWIAFAAIRQLQSEGADVSILDVDDVLAVRDKTYGAFLRDQAGAAFMGMLVCDYPPYNHAVLWEYDMFLLKTYARRRKILEDAA